MENNNNPATDKTVSEKLKRFFTFRSINSKIVLCCLVNCVVLIVVILLIMTQALTDATEEYTLDTIKSDIIHMEDIITDHQNAVWEERDGALYCNGILIGDGTQENAFLDPFLETEAKTGTFCYTFVKTGDEGLTWYGDSRTGYQEGHYLRVAGSTLGPNGESLVGTYIDQKVADVLDNEGEYSGPANVGGGNIYCYYHTLTNPDGEVVGAIVVGRSIAELENSVDRASRSMFVLVIIIIILTGLAMILFTRRWIRSVVQTQNYLKRIGNGELPDDPLVLNTKDEIGEVADSVNEMVRSLKENKRIGAELEVAKDIQANLLPKTFPPFPARNDFDLYASMKPAKEIGGDFYDFFLTSDNKLTIVIADVSGKGVPAALFMVTARTLIKDRARNGLDAAAVLTSTNRLLCEGNSSGLFVTAWIGIVDLATGDVNFANAGHNPPIIGHDGTYKFLKSAPGFVLAGMDGTLYKNQYLHLEKGDVIYLYTDGITEATDPVNNEYGNDRLLSFIQSKDADCEMQDLCISVKADVDAFAGEADQFDDMTMLALRYSGGGMASYEIEVEATVANIEKVTEFVDTCLEKHDCPMKVITQINIVLDEILSNIAFYAYSGITGAMKTIVNYYQEEHKIELRFIDGGMPYNPLDADDPDIHADAKDRAIGGLGIYIVKNTMDKVEYVYDDNKNVLTLTKEL